MKTDRDRWEERYEARGGAVDTAPSTFLNQALADIARGPALDVACGSGRHALHLSRHGFVVDAVDIAMNGLRQVQQVARSERLPIQLIQADLDRFTLPPNRYALTVNVRFLNRDLWPHLKACTRPMGTVLFETFTVDQAAIGHPSNPAYLLAHGELERAFADFDVLVYEEGLFETETGPAYLARLLARRPVHWHPR